MTNRWDYGQATWKQIAALPETSSVFILPIGAIEAHGPHLPLATDEIIALAMAKRGAQLLEQSGWSPRILPPFVYTSASFARGFAGTIDIAAPLVTSMIVAIVRSLASHGNVQVVFANAHFDPVHVSSVRQAVRELSGDTNIKVYFPDATRREYASWLSDEFRSGACHAGCYESSIVLAAAPEMVAVEKMRELADNPHSLVTAIGEHKTSFEEAGGPDAYFGNPAQADAAHGQEMIDTLGQMILHAVTGSRTPPLAT